MLSALFLVRAYKVTSFPPWDLTSTTRSSSAKGIHIIYQCFPNHNTMMLSSTYLGSALSLALLAHALPISQPRQEPCKALIETAPWHITDMVVVNALPNAPTGSAIHFHVTDTNPGLEFDTSCGVSMPVGTGSRPEEAQGWHPCDDGRARFLYQPGSLQIRRSYLDDW